MKELAHACFAGLVAAAVLYGAFVGGVSHLTA
jgi:hypothetical protein